MARLQSWSDRPKEVAYLLNPAFCGRLLHAAVDEYKKKSSIEFPVPLVYLILPLVLHTKTRKAISSRTYLTVWIERNRPLLLNFPERCRDYIEITNEALEYMLQAGYLVLTDTGTLAANKIPKRLNQNLNDDEEIKECVSKSRHVARWFVQAGKVENVFVTLGVRP